MMKKITLSIFLVSALVLLAYTNSVLAAESIPPKKSKQTVLGKYVTALEAYDMWRQNPQSVSIIDVRAPVEYAFVGHATMAVNIPLKFYTWDAVQGTTKSINNDQFEAQVSKRFGQDQTILIICRSGGRGAEAVNRLAQKGFVNVYNITDGFEGDKIKDKRSVFRGKRLRNGWKNALTDWTYDLDPGLVYKE